MECGGLAAAFPNVAEQQLVPQPKKLARNQLQRLTASIAFSFASVTAKLFLLDILLPYAILPSLSIASPLPYPLASLSENYL